MKSAYKIILGLFLAVASLVSAADVAPFYFKSIGDYYSTSLSEEDASILKQLTQHYWDELMKYKVFGAHGIKFLGANIDIWDTVGYVGTVDGDFDMGDANINHNIGGPVIVGGNLILSNGGDTLISGPVRVTGDVVKGYDAWLGGSVQGVHCIKGSVDDEYGLYVRNGNLYSGEVYNNCPSTVPEVLSGVTVPLRHNVLALVHWSKLIDDETQYIDVPRGEGVYDYYVEWIAFANKATLLIRMPSEGRQTRIIAEKDFDFFSATDARIRVVYMDEDAEWDSENERWITTLPEDSLTKVENRDYRGDVLFYTPQDLYLNRLSSTDSIQGTFISGGKILLGENLALAGQLIADTVVFNANFNGSNFMYVPFESPMLERPVLTAGGIFVENDKDVAVPVELSVKAPVDVSFKYCFDIEGELATPKGYAAINDFVGTKNAYFPICGNSEYKTSIIKVGTKEPAAATVVYIHVAEDEVEEGDEILKLKIFDLEGATLKNGAHEGIINMTIADVAPTPKFVHDTSRYVYIAENSPAGSIIKEFSVKYASFADDLYLSVKSQVFGGSSTATSFNAFDEKLVTEKSKVYASLFVDDDELLDYESAPDSVRVTMTLKDLDGNEYDSVVCVVLITDVNEAPAITGLVDTNKDYEGSPTPFTLYPKENLKDGSIVGILNVSDPDVKNKMAYGYLEYSIVDPYGSVPFEMDSNMIVVYDASMLDYEDRSIFEFDVEVTNCERNASSGRILYSGNCFTTTRTITVKTQNVNEPPMIVADKTVETIKIPENPMSGSSVFVYDVLDQDVGDASKLTAMYRVLESNLSDEIKFDSLFNVVYNAALQKIIVTVKDGNLLDYETLKSGTSRNDPDPQIKLSIVVKDPGGLADTVVRIIDITDENEAPIIADMEFSIAEDAPAESIVGMLIAADPDVPLEYSTLTYALMGGDTAMFSVSSSGMLLLKGDLDYEIKDTYNVQVGVSDGEYVDVAEVVVYVEDVVEWSDTAKVDTSVVDTSRTDTTHTDSLEIVKPDSVEIDTAKTEPVKNDSTKTNPKGPKIDSNPVMQDVYVTIASVAKEKIVLDENPEDGVKLNTIKGKGIQVTYVDRSTDVDVTVSYMIDGNGDIKTKTVVDDNGKKISTEVITVSYNAEVDGRDVTVSYQADARTGEILAEDSLGNLMTRNAAKSKPKAGYYTVSYEEIDEDGDVTEVSYKMDERGNILKNSLKNGSGNSDDEKDAEEDGEEIFAEPSFRVEMTGPFQFTIVMEESVALLNAANSKFAVMDLQGRVIRKGHISTAETVVPMPRTGSYIVRVGLRTRRVNLY